MTRINIENYLNCSAIPKDEENSNQERRKIMESQKIIDFDFLIFSDGCISFFSGEK